MARIVPSVLVEAIREMFPNKPDINGPIEYLLVRIGNEGLVSKLASILVLVRQIPENLLPLEQNKLVRLLRSIATIDETLNQWKTIKDPQNYPLSLIDQQHPVAIIRDIFAECPDERHEEKYSSVRFIADTGLRETIELDLGEAWRAASEGGYKAATVLAGSAVEALLLWAIQTRREQHPDAPISGPLDGFPDSKKDPTEWQLATCIAFAAAHGLIGRECNAAASLLRDARNLIHPGREQRKGIRIGRGAAYGALSALDLVIEDLRKLDWPG